VPSELLQNRPDIRASLARLKQNQLLRLQADLELLPSFTLSPRLVTKASTWSNLFEEWIGTFAAQLSGPLFSGRLESARKEVDAMLQGEVARHREVLLKAFHEVEAELTQVLYLKEQKKNNQKLLQLVLEDQNIKEQAYLSGEVSLAQVHLAKQSVLSQRLSNLELEAMAWKQYLTMVKALGISILPDIKEEITPKPRAKVEKEAVRAPRNKKDKASGSSLLLFNVDQE